MIEALITALGTTAGKAAAGLAIASASIGGLAATDVVELPDLSDEPAEVTTEDQAEAPVLPDEAQKGQEAAEAGADDAEDAGQDDEADLEDEGADAADPEANDFGQDVADLAQDPETTGEDVSAFARDNNPGVEARQDGEVRQDDQARQGAAVADERTPEEPGSQAEGRRGGPAADTES